MKHAIGPLEQSAIEFAREKPDTARLRAMREKLSIIHADLTAALAVINSIEPDTKDTQPLSRVPSR